MLEQERTARSDSSEFFTDQSCSIWNMYFLLYSWKHSIKYTQIPKKINIFMNTTLLNNLLKFSSSSIAYFNLKKKKKWKESAYYSKPKWSFWINNTVSAGDDHDVCSSLFQQWWLSRSKFYCTLVKLILTIIVYITLFNIGLPFILNKENNTEYGYRYKHSWEGSKMQ